MRGSRFEMIGASILQTPGATQSELAKIDGEINAHHTEITHAVQAQGGIAPAADSAQGVIAAVQHGIDIATGKAKAPTDNALDNFYHATWLPFFASWKKWYGESDGWLHNLMWNEAPSAEAFQKKLLALREAAKKIGFMFQTPAPDIEGMSPFDPRHESLLDELEKLAKYAVIGGIAVGGVFAIGKIIEAIKR